MRRLREACNLCEMVACLRSRWRAVSELHAALKNSMRRTKAALVVHSPSSCYDVRRPTDGSCNHWYASRDWSRDLASPGSRNSLGSLHVSAVVRTRCNPHSARRSAAELPIAISCLGAFWAPSHQARDWIRNHRRPKVDTGADVPKKTRLRVTLLKMSNNRPRDTCPEGFMDAGAHLSYNASNPILIACAVDLSVCEVYLDHIFR